MEDCSIKDAGCDVLIDVCPWCGSKCQYVETEEDAVPVQVRVGVSCEESLDSEAHHGDALGNDWGRSNWFDSVEEAIFEWNESKKAGEETGQRGVW